MNITLLGANFLTGNLGVSALAGSSIQLLKRRWPESNICIIGGKAYLKHTEFLNGSAIEIECYPLRYSPNVLKKNHILWIYILVRLCVLLPGMKKFLGHKSTANQILKSDLICDITGGDSFSDIYGIKRLVMGYFIKRICQLSNNSFIMLPQTYGPFQSTIAKKLACKILTQADRVYSRDKNSLDVVESLIGKSVKSRICPDVAFTLKPANREKVEEKCSIAKYLIDKIDGLKEEKNQFIGLNISSLLLNGGYTGNNEFGLREDYQMLVKKIITFFLSHDDTLVMLVPHVVPENMTVENDLMACKRVWNNLSENLKKRTIIVETTDDQPFFDECEIKYLIGLCDFFLGSRMHSTIAAISQCIPTIGLAYSKKFEGVYETAGIEDCVLDMRILSNEQILNHIKDVFVRKDIIKDKLKNGIPKVKKQVYSIFDEL